MTLEIIQSEEEFHSLARDWNTLLEKSAIHVPFLRHEYLCSWWQTLGGGEWESGKLQIVLDRLGSGAIQAIAPFFSVGSRLMLLGSYEISDYLDVIAPREFLPSFLEKFLKEIGSQWTTIDFYNLLDDSPTLPVLRETAPDAGWEYREEILQPTPLLVLPQSYAAYLSLLDSRYRHELERKSRRAEEYFLPVEWYFVQQDEDLDREIDDFLQLMAFHPEKAHFLTGVMKTQMRKAIHNAFNAGWLQLAFLTVGGKKAASYLNFDYRNRLYIYNSGLNPIFENLSPGWVLLGYLIEWAIAEGREAVDFMRGDEGYKYQLGGKDRFVTRATLTRET